MDTKPYNKLQPFLLHSTNSLSSHNLRSSPFYSSSCNNTQSQASHLATYDPERSEIPLSTPGLYTLTRCVAVRMSGCPTEVRMGSAQTLGTQHRAFQSTRTQPTWVHPPLLHSLLPNPQRNPHPQTLNPKTHRTLGDCVSHVSEDTKG